MRDEGNKCAESPRRKPYEPLLHLSSCLRYRIESNDQGACSRCKAFPAAHNRQKIVPDWPRSPTLGNASPSPSEAASAVDHRPTNRWRLLRSRGDLGPTVNLAKRLLNNCTPRRRSNLNRRRSPQCEVCSPYRAVRRNTRAIFGWSDQTCVRRITIARGGLSTAAEFGGTSNHMPTRTTTRPQTPSRLTSRRYAGEPKLASRACSKLAGRVLNYALILATLTPLSS